MQVQSSGPGNQLLWFTCLVATLDASKKYNRSAEVWDAHIGQSLKGLAATKLLLDPPSERIHSLAHVLEGHITKSLGDVDRIWIGRVESLGGGLG